MTVLISNPTRELIKEFNPKVKFEDHLIRQATFRITENKFKELLNWLRGKEVNPYAVMYW